MKLIHHLLTLAICSTLPVAGHAQTVPPDPAPTIIATVPYTISKAGFYQLGANLAGPSTNGNLITINADNVILDFAGHYITGPANPSTFLNGVYAKDHNNITIQNGKISFCYEGIVLTGTSGKSNNLFQRVQNMVLAHCSSIGVDVELVQGCNVVGNRFYYIGGSPFVGSTFGVLSDGDGIRIADNDFLNVFPGTEGGTGGAGYGAYASSPNTYIVGNSFTSCTYAIGGGKYKDNLTGNSGAPTGGIDAGGNN